MLDTQCEVQLVVTDQVACQRAWVPLQKYACLCSQKLLTPLLPDNTKYFVLLDI